MEIRQIKAGMLEEFARELADSGVEPLPITPWRAASQAKNPAAADEDTLLLVAYDNEKIVGYTGILPFESSSYFREKVYWNTCWWADPAQPPAVPLALFFKFREITGGRVLFSDLTNKTRHILERIGGFELNSRPGLVLRSRSALHLRLRYRRGNNFLIKSALFLGLFRIVDLLANALYYKPVRRSVQKEKNAGYKTFIIPTLTPEHDDFVTRFADHSLTVPGEDYLDWVKRGSWVVPADQESRDIANRYFFSVLAGSFKIEFIECRVGENLVGLAILGNRDGVVRTHYLFQDPDHAGGFFKSLYAEILSLEKQHTLITFENRFYNYLKVSQVPGKIEEHTRYAGMSVILAEEAGEKVRFQDGDGDYIFT